MSLTSVHQQRNRTLGWPQTKRTTPRVPVLVCALRGRYLGASLPLPTLTWRATSPADGTKAAWDAFALAVVKDATVEEMTDFLQQIHTAILGLAGYYVDEGFSAIDAPALASLGIKAAGAAWPDDTAAATAALQTLLYRVEQVALVSHSFSFAGPARLAARMYAEFATPYQTAPGGQIVAWRIDPSSTSNLGQFYQAPGGASGHRSIRLRLTDAAILAGDPNADAAWLDEVNLKVDGAVLQAFDCLPGAPVVLRRPHAGCLPNIVRPGDTVKVDFTPPAGATSYIATLIEAQAFSNEAGLALTSGLLTLPLTTFSFVCPEVAARTYFVRIVFNVGEPVTCVLSVVTLTGGSGYGNDLIPIGGGLL